MQKSHLNIGWLQNNMVGMEVGEKILMRDPANRYVYYNILHPECRDMSFDAVLIYNYALYDIDVTFPQGTLVVVHNEPAYTHLGWNEFMWDGTSVKQADVLFTANTNDYNCYHYYPYSLLNYDWKRISSFPLDLFDEKSKKISCVSSSKTISVRHAQRAVFTDYLNVYMPECDLYGRERNYIPHLIYGLKDYQYSIAVENTTEPNYFTEKVLSCFHTLTVPFYDGCNNLEEYFPSEAFVRIDITKPKESLKLIHNIINDPLDYQRRLPALREARKIFHEKYELFGRVFQEVQLLYQENSDRIPIKQKIYKPKCMTTDHSVQLNIGYLYAKYSHSYVLNNKTVPSNLLDIVTKKAKKHENVLGHSYLKGK